MRRELIRFGPFELDPAAEELRRAGLVVRIPRQPFRILLLLVERSGEVVSREEIQTAIWGDETYVDFEHGINSAIRQIRFALGDHAEMPRYVRTLPRRGYSFIGTVERVAKSGPIPAVTASITPPPSRPRVSRRTIGIAAATILVIIALIAAAKTINRPRPSAHTIAVQPFRRLGPPIAGVDERSFTEELRATIGSLPRAHVSVVSTRPDVILGGTIRHSEDGIRAIVSLVDARTQTQIWSETFMRPETKREGMAVEVGHRVMHEIARRYLPAPRHEPRLLTKASPAAIGFYKRARQLHGRTMGYDWMRTKELYEAALREEPKLAEAWSGLGDVWGNQAIRGPMADCDRAAAQAKVCARRALALQPSNGEALSTLGVLAAQRDFDLAAAEDAMRRAVTVDPGYAEGHANLAMILTMRGSANESLSEWQIARELDPAEYDLSAIEPFLYMVARRYEDARAHYRDILAVDPQSGPAIWGVLMTYMLENNWSQAIEYTKLLQEQPMQNVPVSQAGFMKVYRSFESSVLERRRTEKYNDYFVAIYYTHLGDHGRAFELLNRAVDLHVPVLSYILVDPRLDPLRGDPRFTAVLNRLNLARPPQQSQLAQREPPPPR